MKATERLLDSVWTLEYEIICGKLYIINFNRYDKEGYENEKQLPQICLVESEGRIITGVYIREKYDAFSWASKKDSTYYEVLNPKFIFSYNNEDYYTEQVIDYYNQIFLDHLMTISNLPTPQLIELVADWDNFIFERKINIDCEMTKEVIEHLSWDEKRYLLAKMENLSADWIEIFKNKLEN